jgi:hypothetical protein
MLLILPDQTKLNVQWTVCPRINEQVKIGSTAFTVVNVLHVIMNNNDQKIEIHLV